MGMEKAKMAAAALGMAAVLSAGAAEAKSVVYFTRDLSAAGLQKAYEKVNGDISGNVAVKLHTGERNGPNILPREWVAALIRKDIPNATIVETNTYYAGDRDTTEKHRETIRVNGWTEVAPVDIIDAEGTALLPVQGGHHFKEMSVGKNLLQYDSLVTLTHFKGHTMGVSADRTKISVSAAQTARLARCGFIAEIPEANGGLARNLSWSG